MAPAAATSDFIDHDVREIYTGVRHAMVVFLLSAFIADVFWELTGQKQFGNAYCWS